MERSDFHERMFGPQSFTSCRAKYNEDEQSAENGSDDGAKPDRPATGLEKSPKAWVSSIHLMSKPPRLKQSEERISSGTQ